MGIILEEGARLVPRYLTMLLDSTTFCIVSKVSKVVKHKLEDVASISKQLKEPKHKRYKVYIKKDYRKLGDPKTYRLFFPTEREARDWVEKRKYKFESMKALTDLQVADAKLALRELDDTGFDTLHTAMKYLQKIKAIEDAKSDLKIDRIVRDKINKVTDLNTKLKKGIRVYGGSSRTLVEYKYYGKIISNNWGHLRVVDFCEDKHFLPIYKRHGSQPNFLKCAKAIFNLCIKKYKGKVIRENPITEQKDEQGEVDPVVFKPGDWRKLILSAIATEEEDFVKGNTYEFTAMIALGLWCGLRPQAEMRQLDTPEKRLKWEDVDLNEKEVWVYSTKTLKHRFVRIPDCAIPILRSVQRDSGFVVKDRNYSKRFRDLINRAGVKWHSDIMRHTFATYYHAQFNDEKELIKQMGHANDTELKFYRKFGKEFRDQAKEFWNFKLQDQLTSKQKSSNLKIA